MLGKYHRPLNELSQTSKKHVIRHISSFPTVESHYLRAKTTKLYLESGLSIAKMYRFYLKWIEENNISTQSITERQYRDIFNLNFNFGFFKPKKDQCNDCTSYANMSTSDKEKFKVSQSKHIRSKNEARRIKNIDKSAAIVRTDIVAACFDFQKVLQCPFGETSVFFYKRKLNLHNFTIYNLASHQGHCYLWDETIASQGSSEVSSCLYKFMLEEKNKNNNVNKFIFWTDNCPGQNKNKILFSFYSWASKKLKIDISHKFLEKGHTQNEGDSMHSTIEKSRKHKTIYVPAQYYSLIRNSKVNGLTYNVCEMDQSDIFNFKNFSNINFFTKNLKNETVQISKIREIFISKNEPNKLLYKYEFDENFEEILLYCESTSTSKRPGRKRKPVNRDTIDLLYNDTRPITECKYIDLMYLCEKNYIPALYKTFYKNLPHTTNIDEDSDD